MFRTFLDLNNSNKIDLNGNKFEVNNPKKDGSLVMRNTIIEFWVWLYEPRLTQGKSNKLISRYDGPYVIVEQTSPDTYKLDSVKNQQIKHCEHSKIEKILQEKRITHK